MATIRDTVCANHGHDIVSLAAKQITVPQTTLLVTQFEVVCSQCGKTLEEIRKERASSGAPRVRKAATPGISTVSSVEAQ